MLEKEIQSTFVPPVTMALPPARGWAVVSLRAELRLPVTDHVPADQTSAAMLVSHAGPGMQMLSSPTTRTRPSVRPTTRVRFRAAWSDPAETQEAGLGVGAGVGLGVGAGVGLASGEADGVEVAPGEPPPGVDPDEAHAPAATATATRTDNSLHCGRLGIGSPWHIGRGQGSLEQEWHAGGVGAR